MLELSSYEIYGEKLNPLIRFFYQILPPLQLHIWGGLGSQLYGISKFQELRPKLQFRKIDIYFHSSGVTRRLPEITKLLPPEIDFFFVNDFDDFVQSSKSIQTNKLNLKNKFLKYSRKIAINLKFVMSLDEWGQFPCLWTLQVRGHYRNQDIPKSIIKQILNIAMSAKLLEIDSQHEEYIAIHYRLDDLINLKNTVDAKLLMHQIFEIKEKFGLAKVLLLSDSFELAKQKLYPIPIYNTEEFTDPWSAINLGINSKVFIGTNSKLSYWIVLFRLMIDSNSVNFLPKSNESEFRKTKYVSSENLFFYKEFIK